ncbi:MAG: DHH family phosphoesterase [Nitrososphaera sp.]
MSESDSEICILTHLDADGIGAGSILASSLARLGAKFCVRIASDMNANLLASIKNESHDFVIVTDLGGGWSGEIRNAFSGNCLIFDHHQISEEEKLTDDENMIFNPWKVDIDGSVEISSGGLCYLVATRLDQINRDLSPLAIVTAVADRQDQGEKRSLLGINEEILKQAQSSGLVNADLDILVAGRETRPCHESLAYTSFPYIHGLTWHPDACYNLLTKAGIKLRDGSRWRTPSELSQEEKSAFIDAIARHIGVSGAEAGGIINELIGRVYTLNNEDARTQLRDAREFGTLLNACGRIGKAGVGVAVCLGDRNNMLSEAERASQSYRSTLKSYLTAIFADKWRITDSPDQVFVHGDGLVASDMLGAVSSVLSGSALMAGKLIFLRTVSSDDPEYFKFSCRKGGSNAPRVNLGLIMRHCAARAGGTGGGHPAAAGCRIPSNSVAEFSKLVRESIGDSRFAKTD